MGRRKVHIPSEHPELPIFQQNIGHHQVQAKVAMEVAQVVGQGSWDWNSLVTEEEMLRDDAIERARLNTGFYRTRMEKRTPLATRNKNREEIKTPIFVELIRHNSKTRPKWKYRELHDEKEWIILMISNSQKTIMNVTLKRAEEFMKEWLLWKFRKILASMPYSLFKNEILIALRDAPIGTKVEFIENWSSTTCPVTRVNLLYPDGRKKQFLFNALSTFYKLLCKYCSCIYFYRIFCRSRSIYNRSTSFLFWAHI